MYFLKAKPPSNSRRQGPTSSRRCSSEAFLSLEARDAEGHPFPFARLANKVTVVVNVAPSRNQTPQVINQYRELTQLRHRYGQDIFEILAFPCAQFQEKPQARSEDSQASYERLGVGFQVMERVAVQGVAQHPVYDLLRQEGPEIRGNLQTTFVVACIGQQCSVLRFDNLPARALRSYIDNLLSEMPTLHSQGEE